jgi:uncharacterized RDD family membrane protein YckC
MKWKSVDRSKEPRTFGAHETMRIQEMHGIPLASFGRRAVAFVIDFLIAFLLFLGVLIGGGKLAGHLGLLTADVNLKFDFQHWYSFLALVVYFALFTYWGNGRTPGKMPMKIRIVSLVHRKMGLWHCIERALGYGASTLEFGFGFFQYFIHPNRRTVHDRIAETIVIDDRRISPAKDLRSAQQA